MKPRQLALPLWKAEAPSAEEGWPLDEAFPEAEANALARQEAFNKHLYRPNTYLHKWWARRSGTLFRYILKGLVRAEGQRDFYAPGGLEGRVVLDPMMGGGTTLHEAIRLGANVIGVDVDPIPVIQARATLTERPLALKRRAFEQAWQALRQRLAPWFRTRCPVCEAEAEVQFVLYARRRRCACGETLFVDDFLLREASRPEEQVRLCPACGQVVTGEHTCPSDATPRLHRKGEKRCPVCGEPYQDLTEVPFWQRYEPVAIRGRCPQGHEFFKSPDEADHALLQAAAETAQGLDWGSPEGWRIPAGPKSQDLLRYGVTSYLDLFTPRQRLFLHAVGEVLPTLEAPDRLWFALLASTALEFHALLCGYKGKGLRRPGAVRHVFAHHAYTIPYTALENNPVFPEPRSGTLQRLFRDRIERAARWAQAPVERRYVRGRWRKVALLGERDGGVEVSRWEDLTQGSRRFLVRQGDAAQVEFPPGVADFVVTDPPYYDSVQYSDLSHFFRVWLQWWLPDAAEWAYDPLTSAVSERGAADAEKYAQALTGIWKQAARALKRPHGRLVFTFHHWRPEAWAALTLSLRAAGFRLVNRYVVFSENPLSVHIQGLRALRHDAILVLAPQGVQAPWRPWPPVHRIPKEDSEAFVRACADALGWLLVMPELSPQEIWQRWKNLLEDE